MFITGFGIVYFECGTLVWIISLWKSKSPPIVHLTHAMFSIGVLVAPIMCAPFLLGDVTKNDPQMAALNTTLRDQINYSINRRPKLMIPFLIGGAICATSKNRKSTRSINNYFEHTINDNNSLIYSTFLSNNVIFRTK